MTILQRIFTIGASEAHPSVEELKEPIKRTEQGIRDMRLDLEKSVRALEALGQEEGNATPASAAPNKGNEAVPTRAELEEKIKTLKTNLRKWEMQLRVLKSRVTVSNATKTINRQMAQLNAPGSLTLLENRKEQEASAHSQALPSDGNLSSPEEPQEICTPQNFAQKADALNDALGLAPTAPAPDAPTTQP